MHFSTTTLIFQDSSVFGPSLLFHGHNCSWQNPHRGGSGWTIQSQPQVDSGYSKVTIAPWSDSLASPCSVSKRRNMGKSFYFLSSPPSERCFSQLLDLFLGWSCRLRETEDSRHAALQSLGIVLSPTLGKENLEEGLICHHWGNTLCAKTASVYGV